MLRFIKRLFSTADIRCPTCESLSLVVPGADKTKYLCTECKTRSTLTDGKFVKD